ncbi:glycosyltransferase [Paraglaciecola arctica]|uniref:glycosyltransferase n=1 Tax=Paraglaciecola arctica TaxID=1128911 RepID=UPI001C0782BD|nr:glycosyltransferase [Paraglaciecola arctica]MBU3005720.1 glycosyltransferase [Paraglaciecola arctica]
MKLLKQFKLPWFIQSRIDRGKNQYAYYKNTFLYNFRNPAHSSKIKPKITFQCGFHGTTGAVESIANIANLLSERYVVEFVSYPSSNFNHKLHHTVKIVHKFGLDSQMYFCDLSCDEAILKNLRDENKKILISVHGMLHSQFGLSAKQKMEAIQYADIVQFVSPIQQEEYQLDPDKVIIIPNMVNSNKKDKFTNNVGVVGNLNLVNKNVNASVDIALASKMDEIHLWSIETDKWNNSKVICHSWENDKYKIYSTFDVLVFMSQEEALSMVVLEAMSMGIPCLLSNIPAFEQFSNCPGVHLVNPNEVSEASLILNKLLDSKSALRQNILYYWETLYSKNAVKKQWLESISNLI